MLSQLDEKIRAQFSERVLVITKNEDTKIVRRIKNALDTIFENFDSEKQIMDAFKTDCRDIF